MTVDENKIKVLLVILNTKRFTNDFILSQNYSFTVVTIPAIVGYKTFVKLLSMAAKDSNFTSLLLVMTTGIFTTVKL